MCILIRKLLKFSIDIVSYPEICVGGSLAFLFIQKGFLYTRICKDYTRINTSACHRIVSKERRNCSPHKPPHPFDAWGKSGNNTNEPPRLNEWGGGLGGIHWKKKEAPFWGFVFGFIKKTHHHAHCLRKHNRFLRFSGQENSSTLSLISAKDG